jgi:hypothetical protein
MVGSSTQNSILPLVTVKVLSVDSHVNVYKRKNRSTQKIYNAGTEGKCTYYALKLKKETNKTPETNTLLSVPFFL